jgi:hypothetical protein
MRIGGLIGLILRRHAFERRARVRGFQHEMPVIDSEAGAFGFGVAG